MSGMAFMGERAAARRCACSIGLWQGRDQRAVRSCTANCAQGQLPYLLDFDCFYLKVPTVQLTIQHTFGMAVPGSRRDPVFTFGG